LRDCHLEVKDFEPYLQEASDGHGYQYACHMSHGYQYACPPAIHATISPRVLSSERHIDTLVGALHGLLSLNCSHMMLGQARPIACQLASALREGA
jgi:hypothetical protein